MQNQYISAVFWHHFYLNSLKIHLVIPVIKGGTATAIIMKKFKKIIPSDYKKIVQYTEDFIEHGMSIKEAQIEAFYKSQKENA